MNTECPIKCSVEGSSSSQMFISLYLIQMLCSYKVILILMYTLCPRSLDQFYVTSYFVLPIGYKGNTTKEYFARLMHFMTQYEKVLKNVIKSL